MANPFSWYIKEWKDCKTDIDGGSYGRTLLVCLILQPLLVGILTWCLLHVYIEDTNKKQLLLLKLDKVEQILKAELEKTNKKEKK